MADEIIRPGEKTVTVGGTAPPMAVGVSFDFSSAPRGFITMRYQEGPVGLERELRLPMTAAGLLAAELALRAVGIQPNFQGGIIDGPSLMMRRG